MKKIHLMGLAGMGMINLAGLFKDKGYDVQGSDKEQIYPPASTEIERLGLKVCLGYKAQNITSDIDLVIVGNVISKNNPEYIALEKSGIPFTSMSGAIAEYFIEDRESIVVTGTHGKTTTSSLMAHILSALDQKPGFFIGGIPNTFGKGFEVSQGDYFVVEGDEYDTACFEKTPKFLHYKAKHVILTSIEFDHADIYDDLETIIEEFEKLIVQCGDDQVIVANGDNPNIQKLIEKHPQKNWMTYGLETFNAFYLKDHAYKGEGFSSFDIVSSEEENTYTVQTRMLGKHNAQNILACFVLCQKLGLDAQKILKAIETFTGVGRRQQWLSSNQSVHIYDDFAHHPSAVKSTIEAFVPIKEKNGGELWTIFEPRSNTARRNTFQEVWPNCFKGAEHVIFTPVFNKGDGLKDVLDTEKLAQTLKDKGFKAYMPQSYEEVYAHLKTHVKPQDTVLFMSNGDFKGIRAKLVELYKAN